jgi:hypothetical protein
MNERATGIRHALVFLLTVLGMGLLGAPRPAATQGLSVVGGALAGAGAGAWLSVAYITTQSRRGDYLESDEEAVGMAAIPLFTGLTAGLALGVFAEDQMGETLAWGAVGWASGIGIGALIGDRVWDDPQRRWAGGVIGGAVGLVVGGVAGLISSSGDGEAIAADGLPLQIRIRF